MLIDYEAMPGKTIPGLNAGTGELTYKLYGNDDFGESVLCRLHPGGSIGMHAHANESDISYIISGEGKAVCDGFEELLKPGTCHICTKGSKHSITNTGDEDLVIWTVIVDPYIPNV